MYHSKKDRSEKRVDSSICVKSSAPKKSETKIDYLVTKFNKTPLMPI